MRKGQFTVNYSKEFREKIKKNFGTDDEKEIKQIVLKFLEHGELANLSLRDEMLLERLQIIREQRPEQLKKLQIQNEILEKKRDFLYHFQKPMSESGSNTFTNSTYKKYGYSQSENIQENIQLKKNYYINKIQDGEFCGCCKVCGNFSTDICTTSKEAELDVELHLESIHQTGLFQR